MYLGLDCSTQGLSAVLIRITNGRAHIVWEHELEFDQACPEFGTHHGVLPAADPRVKVSDPRMWVRALELMFDALGRCGEDLATLRAISGSAQQHGSVYLDAAGALTRPVAPIWMDSSTRDECAEITAALGGAHRLALRTGARAFERFTGPQIRRFAKNDPDAYANTASIHLVSSFLASQLTGVRSPMEPGDASGMNLMDLVTRDWWSEAVEATAPDLRQRLPPIVASDTVIGRLTPDWQARANCPAVPVVVWTGDNSSSVIGTGLVEAGRVAVSLGTSDTLVSLMPQPQVDAEGAGYVFLAPTGDYMGITVFKNGSLARERVRDAFGLDWAGFSALLRSTPPGNHGRLMYPWFDPEITPDVPIAGVRRVNLADDDVAGNVRAVVEGQMMAMANYSRWMGVTVQSIHATGGAAANRDVLQVMANVFGVPVTPFTQGNSAALGAALRAWHAEGKARGGAVSWAEVTRDLAASTDGDPVLPEPAAVAVYADLRQVYDAQGLQWRNLQEGAHG